MSEDEEDAVAVVARALRRHFAAHPAAADTVLGIQQWWLVPALDVPLPLIELALDRLIHEEVVRRVQLDDGSVVYVSAARSGAADAPPGWS
jgi:hypothetical protein